MAALQEVESGVLIAEVIRKHGISRATFFTLKAKFGGSSVAELALENAAIRDVPSRKL